MSSRSSVRQAGVDPALRENEKEYCTAWNPVILTRETYSFVALLAIAEFTFFVTIGLKFSRTSCPLMPSLDNSENRCNMGRRDPAPLTAVPQKTANERPAGDQNMKAKILTFSSHGDTTLLEYDPATADMDEVNKMIAEYEAKTGAQPFDLTTGERIDKVTPEQREVLMVHPIAGG